MHQLELSFVDQPETRSARVQRILCGNIEVVQVAARMFDEAAEAEATALAGPSAAQGTAETHGTDRQIHTLPPASAARTH